MVGRTISHYKQGVTCIPKPELYYAVMGYLVDSSSYYILGVGVPAQVASTIVL